MTNQLAKATSPYLRQHSENPVDWLEWGDTAFALARERDVPVFLSVGYAACHWCHVMAHESFDDPGIAEILNRDFVSIKVDREERPDVDSYYMRATQALTGQGGWPMSVFLDPEAQPFYAGTYFPPAPSHGRPSFTQVLLGIADMWGNDRDRVGTAATRVSAAIQDPVGTATRTSGFEKQSATGIELGNDGGSTPSDTGGRGVLGAEHDPTQDLIVTCDTAADLLSGQFDETDAGFGSAPKFPPGMALEFLLNHHTRTRSARSLEIVSRTCEAMARGGMYDQLGGGFARYSVDSAWVVPHFEKMLYDNAQLLRLYLHWWRATGSPLGEKVARETAEFLIDELRTPEGGFASSLDADSAPIEPDQPAEGAYYVWNSEQLGAALPADDADWARDLLTVTRGGTYEAGYSVLQLHSDPPDPDRWQRIRERLREVRSSRARPGRDDKVVAAWNGLAITALCEAATILNEPRYLEAATAAGHLLVERHVSWPAADGNPGRNPKSGTLLRVSRDGVVGNPPGVLEDYGDVASGFLSLYQTTANTMWLRNAGTLVQAGLARFRSPGGIGFVDSDPSNAALIPVTTDPSDNAYPSGTSAILHALVGFAALSGDTEAKEAADQALVVLTGRIQQQPRFFGWTLSVMEAVIAGPLAVAITSGTEDQRHRLLQVAFRGTSPGLVVAYQPPEVAARGGDPQGTESARDQVAQAVPTTHTIAENPAILAGRPTTLPAATAYVCREFVCQAPTSDPEVLATLVGRTMGR